MANSGTKIYNEKHDLIYPISIASAITVNSLRYSDTKGTVEEDLRYLSERINSLSGDEETISGLRITIKYALSTKDTELAMIGELDENDWANNFKLPTLEKRFCWKQTTFKLSGQYPVIVYEIVSTYAIPYKSETIYLASSSNTVSNDDKLKYGKITVEVNGEIQEQDDPNQFSFDDNPNWSKYPSNLGGDKKFLIMSVRETKDDGTWNFFSSPSVIGYYDDSNIS